MYKLRIYLAGKSKRDEKNVGELREILEYKLKNQYSLQVIDVLDSRELAIQDNVLATPVLIKLEPQPVRKLLGDFGDYEKLMLLLGMADREDDKQNFLNIKDEQ